MSEEPLQPKKGATAKRGTLRDAPTPPHHVQRDEDQRFYCITCKDRGRKPWKHKNKFRLRGHGKGSNVANYQCVQCSEEDLEAHAEGNKVHFVSKMLAEASVRRLLRGKRATDEGLDFGEKKITAVADHLLEFFGGTKGFAQKYYRQVKAACVREPGSARALSAMRDICKLLEATGQLQQQEELASLDQRQFQAFIRAQTRRVVMDASDEEVLQMMEEATLDVEFVDPDEEAKKLQDQAVLTYVEADEEEAPPYA